MDNPIIKALVNVLSQIPNSKEGQSQQPAARAQEIVNAACLKAAATSGSLSALPGPLSYLTMIPDIMAIWRLQAQMVADIAHVYGKEASLGREVMLYCLFRHGGSALVRDLATRLGERLLLRKPTLKVFQAVLNKIGLHLSQRVLKQGVSRWVPILGAAGMAGYAFMDTRKVGQTAIATFSSDFELEAASEETPPLLLDLAENETAEALKQELHEDAPTRQS